MASYPGSFNSDITRDLNSGLTEPFLGSTHIPMPSSMQEGTLTKGFSINLPSGGTAEQIRFEGKTFTWTWDGLSYADHEALKDAIEAAQFTLTQLLVPAPTAHANWTTVPEKRCVKPNGFSAFSSEIRWNPASRTARWTATMSWVEHPGACTPT